MAFLMYANQSQARSKPSSLAENHAFLELSNTHTEIESSSIAPDHFDLPKNSFDVAATTENACPARMFFNPLETHSYLQPTDVEYEQASFIGKISLQSSALYPILENKTHFSASSNFTGSKHTSTVDDLQPTFVVEPTPLLTSESDLKEHFSSRNIVNFNTVEVPGFPDSILSYGSGVDPPQFVFRKNSSDSSERHKGVEGDSLKYLDLPELTEHSQSKHETPRSHPHTEIAKHLSPSMNNFFTNYSTRAENVDDAQEAFIRLVSSLNTVQTSHFGLFLVDVLRECRDPLPLNDFYCEIYRQCADKNINAGNDHTGGLHNHFSRERLKAIKLQRLVLKSFKNPHKFQYGLLQNSLFCAVSYHEVQRSFLAVKILFEFVEKVEDKTHTITRFSLYKAYYILCQKLIHKYPEISNSLNLERHLILGQSKLGILIKLVHPDLVWKRLGKRGHSKTHYIGINWNRSMVDDEVIALLESDLSEIPDKVKKRKYHMTQEKSKCQTRKQPKLPNVINRPMKSMTLVSEKKPLYSFVDLACKYPDFDCSPRVWELTNNKVPRHSEWAKSLLERSVSLLKGHGVNLESLIANINAGIYYDDHQFIISGTVIKSVNILLECSASNETFLHLYISIMVSILPSIIASDKEIPAVLKMQLRASVKTCVVKLENEFANLSSIDKVSLTTFTRILRKMIHINEMTSSSVKSCSSLTVFGEMVRDMRSLNSTSECSSEISGFTDMFIKGAIKSINAYKPGFSEISSVADQAASVTNILNIGKAFHDVSLIAIRTMSQISLKFDEEEAYKDVPYHVFHLSVKLVHERALLYPELSSLPIPIITSMVISYTNEMQKVSFAAFAKRGPDLSKETFKSWWVFSSMYQEYMSVIAEVVALSQALA
ncbi:hypothetical protein JCM33374_g6625 [Metschnikowia sp. JCM 33374]|nr:hypothetical protein JCM33374_g6625 [Metschnikowia sp. JCM 33374]